MTLDRGRHNPQSCLRTKYRNTDTLTGLEDYGNQDRP